MTLNCSKTWLISPSFLCVVRISDRANPRATAAFIIPRMWLGSPLPWYNLCLLFLLLDALLVTQIDIVRLAAIFEAIDTTTQDTALTLAIVLENILVEVPDELADGRGFLRVDILAP